MMKDFRECLTKIIQMFSESLIETINASTCTLSFCDTVSTGQKCDVNSSRILQKLLCLFYVALMNSVPLFILSVAANEHRIRGNQKERKRRIKQCASFLRWDSGRCLSFMTFSDFSSLKTFSCLPDARLLLFQIHPGAQRQTASGQQKPICLLHIDAQDFRRDINGCWMLHMYG